VAAREGVPLCTLDGEIARHASGACAIVQP
jgi:hypothetical protein